MKVVGSTISGAVLRRLVLVSALALTSNMVVSGGDLVIAEEPPTAPQLDPATMTDQQLAGSFPYEFAFLADEYGLSAAGAADAVRLTWTAGSTREWAMGSIAGYAGTWIDYRKGTVFVGVAGGSRAMKDAQRNLARAPGATAGRTSLIARQRPMATLLSDARLLATTVDPLDTGTVYVQIDEQRNSLVVEGMSAERSRQLPAVTRLVRGEGYSPVQFREAEVADPADVRGGWDGKQGAGCTMGFAVVNPANQRGVLTAGHCADNSVSVSGVTLSGAQFDRSFWTTGPTDYGYDRQLHLVPSGTMTVGSLLVPGVNISGSFLPAAGSVICRYGASSVGKGQSTAFCSTVSGYGYDGFVGMRHGCIYGDSGGPMWVLGKAVGISAVTTDPTWPVDASSTCYAAPVKDQLNGTGFYLQDATYGYGSDFRNIGLYHPISQQRVIDTRQTGGATVGEVDVSLAGALNFPDVGSVALSVTIVPLGVAGTARVYPGDDGIVPFTYDVSFAASGAESNLVVSRVNRYTKSVKVSVSATAFVIVDVLGYFSDTSGTVGAGGATKVVALTPARVYDSRSTTPMPSTTSRDIQVHGIGGVPATATAVIANLTVTRTTGSGWLTAHAGGTSSGGTSNLNYLAGQTKARQAIVALDANGRLRLSTGGPGQIDVIVDVQGYFTAATTSNDGRTFAVDGGGGRLLDTRGGTPVAAGGNVCVNVYASRTEAGNGLPRDGLTGVWLALTVVGVSGAGYVTAAPGAQLTAVSNVNFIAGEGRTNSLFVAVPSTTDGTVCIKVSTSSAHVVVDVLAMTVA